MFTTFALAPVAIGLSLAIPALAALDTVPEEEEVIVVAPDDESIVRIIVNGKEIDIDDLADLEDIEELEDLEIDVNVESILDNVHDHLSMHLGDDEIHRLHEHLNAMQNRFAFRFDDEDGNFFFAEPGDLHEHFEMHFEGLPQKVRKFAGTMPHAPQLSEIYELALPEHSAKLKGLFGGPHADDVEMHGQVIIVTPDGKKVIELGPEDMAGNQFVWRMQDGDACCNCDCPHCGAGKKTDSLAKKKKAQMKVQKQVEEKIRQRKSEAQDVRKKVRQRLQRVPAGTAAPAPPGAVKRVPSQRIMRTAPGEMKVVIENDGDHELAEIEDFIVAEMHDRAASPTDRDLDARVKALEKKIDRLTKMLDRMIERLEID